MKKLLFIIPLFAFVLEIQAQQHDLNYYMNQAKKNSPLIRKSENDNKLVQLNMEQVESILKKPKVDVDASLLFAPIISHDNGSNQFQWVSPGASDYTGYDLAYSDGGQYQAYITVQQPLFRGSMGKAYKENARISNLKNENSIQLTNHELEQLVSRQYILCLKSKAQSEISRELVDSLNREVELLKILVKNAIYKQTDLLLLQIELQNYQLQYQNYISEYRFNLSDLNVLCGIQDSAMVKLVDVQFELRPDTLSQSRFLTSYILDSLQIESNRMMFNQKYKPQLNLFANAGMGAIYLPDFNRLGFSTGLSFSWTIFDGNQKKIQEQKSMVKLQTLEFEKQNFIKQYSNTKFKFLNRIASISKQIKIVETQLESYTQLMNLYKIKISNSQISIMEFKILIQDISAKKQELLLLKMQKQILINSYNYWNY